MDASGDDEREARELPAAKRARGDGDGGAAAAVPAAVQQSPTGLLVTAAAAEAVAGKIVGRAMTTAAELDDQCRALAPEEVDAVCGRRVHLHLPYVAFGTCSTCCLLLSEGRVLTPGPPPSSSSPWRRYMRDKWWYSGEERAAADAAAAAARKEQEESMGVGAGDAKAAAADKSQKKKRRGQNKGRDKDNKLQRTRFCNSVRDGVECGLVLCAHIPVLTTTHSTGCLVGPGQTRELQVQPRL